MKPGSIVLAILAVQLPTRSVHADPSTPSCGDAIADPIATPFHDGGLDAQRGACLRDELSSTIGAHALIDTPGFHGLLGGDLELAGRFALRPQFELGARLRLVDFAFVQTAVNKVTATQFGPLGVGAAWADRLGERAAAGVAVSAEVPYSRDQMDTLHAAGGIDALVSASLAERWTLHARLGTFATLASSEGGTTTRLGLRAGADIARRIRHTIAVLGGLEAQAGFHGFDTLMIRAGFQKRVGNFRGIVAVGVPAGAGSDQTTAVLTLGLARDL